MFFLFRYFSSYVFFSFASLSILLSLSITLPAPTFPFFSQQQSIYQCIFIYHPIIIYQLHYLLTFSPFLSTPATNIYHYHYLLSLLSISLPPPLIFPSNYLTINASLSTTPSLVIYRFLGHSHAISNPVRPKQVLVSGSKLQRLRNLV